MKKLLEKNNLKKEKGITLIALVITIIVLLILAGVAVGMLRTDNSILSQSRNAKKDTNTAQVKENVQLALYDAVGQAAVAGTEDLSTYIGPAIKAYYSDFDPDNDLETTAEGYVATITTGGKVYTIPILSDGTIDVDNIDIEDATPESP